MGEANFYYFTCLNHVGVHEGGQSRGGGSPVGERLLLRQVLRAPIQLSERPGEVMDLVGHCANQKMQIAEVNCGEYPQICAKHKICENPTILLFKDGRPVQEYKRLDFGYEISAFKRFLRPHVNLWMKNTKWGHSTLDTHD